MSRRVIAAVAVAAMAATALAACGGDSSRPVPRALASYSRSVMTTAAVPQLRHVRRFSLTYRLTPSGPLAHPQTVHLPLTSRVPDGWVVVVATAETAQGQWTYIPASLSASRRSVTFVTSHHSVFTVIGENLRALVSLFKAQFLDGLSSGVTASAAPPSCSGQTAARDGYSVDSNSGPAVYWCFGTDSSGQRILRVVNDRLYPMEIEHSGLTVAEHSGVDLLSLASLSHLISGRESILSPGGEIGYHVDIPAGYHGGAQTTMDGLGQSLYALQTGINALLAILTRFGVGSPSKSITILSNTLGYAGCGDAMASHDPGSILASCLSPKEMIEDFGTAGVLLAPLAASGAVTEFFISEFEGLHDVWTNEDDYAIVVNHLAQPVVPSCSAPLLFAAAVTAEHFSTNASQYPPDAGPGPGAYDLVCDSGWALAEISHPHLGTQDSFTLFRAQGGTWTLVDLIGGFFGDCNLEREGVPAAIAKVLWPAHGLPASETCPPQ